jgi:glycosyltransferase involved in cell wall biosynthesis
VVVAFLGRVVMEKGLDAFADAIAELNRRGVKHRVMVIGDGPARGWFANHLPEDAIYLGYQAGRSLGRFLASADMLLNPSVTEAFGNVTLEAMASGIPVVAARATGADFLVNDGVTGVLCTPGQTNEYADALQAYIEQPELRARHGAAGERRSLDFDWDRINQAMVDTYLRLGQKRLGR